GALGHEDEWQTGDERRERRARAGVAEDSVATRQQRRERQPTLHVHARGQIAERRGIVQFADRDDHVHLLAGQAGEKGRELLRLAEEWGRPERYVDGRTLAECRRP